jgi:glycosyltransferase involved in cell wall biosynthesis
MRRMACNGLSLEPPLNPAAEFGPPPARLTARPHLDVILPSLARGGAERSVLDVLDGVDGAGGSGNLFVLHHLQPEFVTRPWRNVAVHRLGGAAAAAKAEAIVSRLVGEGRHVVFTHMVPVAFLRLLWAGGLRTVPVIQNAAPAWQDPPSSFESPFVPFLVAVSDAVAAQLRSAGCPKRVVVLRHEIQTPDTPAPGLSRSSIRRRWGIAADDLVIGMVGQFKAQKNYPRAVRVLSEVCGHRPATLLIVGGWNHDYGYGRLTHAATVECVRRLGLEDRVVMTGPVEDARPYYDAFDVFLNTSDFEGLSVALLEALQHGCAVVTADVGGACEVVPSNAIVVQDPSDVPAYAAGILGVCAQASRRPPAARTIPDLLPRLWCLLIRWAAHDLAEQPARDALVFVTDNLNVGGAQHSLVNLLMHMPSGVRRVLCVLGGAYGGESLLASLERAGVGVYPLNGQGEAIDAAERIIEILSHEGAGTLCFWNVAAAVKLLLAKVMVDDRVRLVDVSPGPMLLREMDAAAGLQARIAFTAAQYFARLHCVVEKHSHGPVQAALGNTGRVCVIRNGVAPPVDGARRIAVGPEAPRRHLLVGTVCRMVPSKRLDYLVDVMRTLAIEMPSATLVIVGATEQAHAEYWRRVTARIQRYGLTNIAFAGARDDVWDWLRRFEVFLLVSRDQGCPNASLEAMACGLPVVASSDGGTAEQVRDGVNGFLVDENDPADMANRVAFLLRNPSVGAAMGAAGATIAQNDFSMSAMVDRYCRLLVH